MSLFYWDFYYVGVTEWIITIWGKLPCTGGQGMSLRWLNVPIPNVMISLSKNVFLPHEAAERPVWHLVSINSNVVWGTNLNNRCLYWQRFKGARFPSHKLRVKTSWVQQRHLLKNEASLCKYETHVSDHKWKPMRWFILQDVLWAHACYGIQAHTCMHIYMYIQSCSPSVNVI